MQIDRHVIGPHDGEQLLNLGGHVNIKLAAEATGGSFAVLEHRVPPQGGPPPHTHPETELLYILSGTFAVTIGSEQSQVEEGTLIYVPPYTVHTTRNVGAKAGRQLSVYLPGGGEGFFREAGTAVTSSDAMPDFDQPVNLAGIDMARILSIAAKYKIQVQTDAASRPAS